MPHNLRAKLSGLRYKGILEDKDYKRLCHALDLEKAEQKPCEDAISRQAAIFLADELKNDLPDDERIADMVMAHNEGILEYQTQLSLLPPVTPQPKRGRWIPGEKAPIECDRCGYGVMPWNNTEYCPKCGCRMVESQESEG